jgi:hypothetical protein
MDVDGSDDEDDSDEMEDDEEDFEEQIQQILESQEANIHHDPVPVPEHTDPFDSPQERQTFLTSLKIMCQEEIVPCGYQLNPDEWGENGYPSFEIIPAGRHKRKELRISLPDAVWRPRAELWAQAHHALSNIHYMRNNP